MKAQLPIIIALAIVMAIIISTTLYLTTIPVSIKYSYTGKQYSDWEIYDHELTQLLLYMLRAGASKASLAIENYIQNKLFVQTISYDSIAAPVDLYYWFWYLTTLYVPVGKEYTAITPTYYSSTLTTQLSDIATTTLNTTAYPILLNWISNMKKLGIRVILDGFSTSYNISISRVGTTTIGKTDVSINFTLTIFNSLGEYRVYTKTSLLHCQENFTSGYHSGKDSISGGFILPVLVQSYLVIDGTKYYYVLSPSDLKTYYYSPLFSMLPAFSAEYGGKQVVQAYIINNGQAAFYRGNGITNFTTIIRYTNYDQFIVDWIKYVHFSSIIDIIRSTQLDWNNVFHVFDEMTWNLGYYADTNLTLGYWTSVNEINITDIVGNNVQIVVSSSGTTLINYTKVMNFYIPGYSLVNVNGIPIIVPTQVYIHYRGEYDSYTWLDTYSFDIQITG